VEIGGVIGARADLLRRRAIVLLDEALRSPSREDAAPRTEPLAFELAREVLLPGDPKLVPGGRTWIILSLGLPVRRASDVRGPLANPNELRRDASSDPY
jgi:hypothetical protein